MSECSTSHVDLVYVTEARPLLKGGGALSHCISSIMLLAPVFIVPILFLSGEGLMWTIFKRTSKLGCSIRATAFQVWEVLCEGSFTSFVFMFWVVALFASFAWMRTIATFTPNTTQQHPIDGSCATGKPKLSQQKRMERKLPSRKKKGDAGKKRATSFVPVQLQLIPSATFAVHASQDDEEIDLLAFAARSNPVKHPAKSRDRKQKSASSPQTSLSPTQRGRRSTQGTLHPLVDTGDRIPVPSDTSGDVKPTSAATVAAGTSRDIPDVPAPKPQIVHVTSEATVSKVKSKLEVSSQNDEIQRPGNHTNSKHKDKTTALRRLRKENTPTPSLKKSQTGKFLVPKSSFTSSPGITVRNKANKATPPTSGGVWNKLPTTTLFNNSDQNRLCEPETRILQPENRTSLSQNRTSLSQNRTSLPPTRTNNFPRIYQPQNQPHNTTSNKRETRKPFNTRQTAQGGQRFLAAEQVNLQQKRCFAIDNVVFEAESKDEPLELAQQMANSVLDLGYTPKSGGSHSVAVDVDIGGSFGGAQGVFHNNMLLAGGMQPGFSTSQPHKLQHEDTFESELEMDLHSIATAMSSSVLD